MMLQDRQGVLLSQDVLDHRAVYFGQSLAPALVQVAERILIEAELVKDRGMKVTDMDGIFYGFQPDRIGGSVDDSAFYSAAAHEPRKAEVVVIASLAALGFGRAATDRSSRQLLRSR